MLRNLSKSSNWSCSTKNAFSISMVSLKAWLSLKKVKVVIVSANTNHRRPSDLRWLSSRCYLQLKACGEAYAQFLAVEVILSAVV